MARFVKRAAAAGGPSPGPRLDHDSKMAVKFPALWEFLTLTSWGDDQPRAPGSLTLFLGESGLQACVADKDGGRVAFVSADSLELLLQSVEGGLAVDKLDWRKPREQGGGRTGKKG